MSQSGNAKGRQLAANASAALNIIKIWTPKSQQESQSQQESFIQLLCRSKSTEYWGDTERENGKNFWEHRENEKIKCFGAYLKFSSVVFLLPLLVFIIHFISIVLFMFGWMDGWMVSSFPASQLYTSFFGLIWCCYNCCCCCCISSYSRWCSLVLGFVALFHFYLIVGLSGLLFLFFRAVPTATPHSLGLTPSLRFWLNHCFQLRTLLLLLFIMYFDCFSLHLLPTNRSADL